MRRLSPPSVRCSDGWIVRAWPAWEGEIYRCGEAPTLGGRGNSGLYASSRWEEAIGYESWNRCGACVLAAFPAPGEVEELTRAPELDGEEPEGWVSFPEAYHSGLEDAVTYRAPRSAQVEGRVLAVMSTAPTHNVRWRPTGFQALRGGWSMADQIAVVPGPRLPRRAALALRAR